MTDQPTLTMGLSLNVLERGRYKRSIIMTAIENGLDFTVEEHKGFFVSLYVFTFTGNLEMLEIFRQAIKRWVNK